MAPISSRISTSAVARTGGRHRDDEPELALRELALRLKSGTYFRSCSRVLGVFLSFFKVLVTHETLIVCDARRVRRLASGAALRCSTPASGAPRDVTRCDMCATSRRI